MSDFQWDAAFDAAKDLSYESAAEIAADKTKPDRERYVAAERALSASADPANTDSLIRGLLDEADCNLQRLAVSAYEQRSSLQQSVRSTLWKMAAGRHQNQFYALRCLAIHDDDRVLKVCQSMFAEGRVTEAETVLGFLGTDRARLLLHEFIKSGRISQAMRANIAISLCRCGDNSYVHMLEQRLGHVNFWWWVPVIGGNYKWERIAIAAALEMSGSEIGRKEVERIRRKGSENERRVLQYALDAFKSRRQHQ